MLNQIIIENFNSYTCLFTYKLYTCSGTGFTLSKDFQHNLRDLFKSKGKKLADEKDQSKTASKEKLAESFSQLSSQTKLSPLLQDKLLKLHINLPTSPPPTVPTEVSYKSHKTEVQFILLSFGINFQRVYGSAIPSVQFLYDHFITAHPEITHFLFKDCDKSIQTLHEQGLLYQLSPELLFEPLETSANINQLFSLLESNSNSIQVSTIQKHLPDWSPEKIQRVISTLVDNGLAIPDGDILWFPQLE